MAGHCFPSVCGHAMLGTTNMQHDASWACNGTHVSLCLDETKGLPTLQVLPRRRQVVPFALCRPVRWAAHHRLCAQLTSLLSSCCAAAASIASIGIDRGLAECAVSPEMA